MEAFGFVAIRQLIVRSAVMICFFIFIKQTTDYTLYFALHSAGLVTMVILNVRRVFTENNWPLHKPELKKHLAPLFHFFLTSSAITLYIYFDTFLLQKITNDHSLVGYYTTAVKLVKIFLVGLLALGTILLPRISYLVSSGDVESVKKHLNKNLEFIIVIGLPISIGIMLLAPEAVVVIAGEKFSPATPLLQIMSFIPLVISISNLFCFQTLIPFKKEKFFLVVVLLGCVVSISLNLFLIPIFSAQGSAYANIITESIIAILSGIFAYRSLQFKINTTMVLQCVFCCLFFIPVIFICRNYFHNNLITFCISITACPLIYFLIQRLIFKNTTIKGIEDYVIQLIRRN
jgi:O-antigen/teichoic acid export membrane protein